MNHREHRSKTVATSTYQYALTEKEAALYTAMSRSFLRQARMDGDRTGRTPGPTYLKIGRAVRYLKEDLDSWLAQFRADYQS